MNYETFETLVQEHFFVIEVMQVFKSKENFLTLIKCGNTGDYTPANNLLQQKLMQIEKIENSFMVSRQLEEDERIRRREEVVGQMTSDELHKKTTTELKEMCKKLGVVPMHYKKQNYIDEILKY